ncbi:hypothetical protein [Methylomicrobium sp. Wu6]|uniref:hypothetical protein n=1 Tax=Methylomicrobium sp. Wu6 TaxID=3107928 RepID=UPI002DD6930B|nr:hypothetical protein [Methylomicrobium sp. Wu6]MEC4748135.1 hypothetical protein [Methylomicrobium sp. Wu6]
MLFTGCKRTSREALIEELFDKLGVLSPDELASRFGIFAEQYILSIDVEAKLVVTMAKTGIYPAAVKYLSDLSSAINSLKSNGVELDAGPLIRITELLTAMMEAVGKLAASLTQYDFSTIEEHMQFCAKNIRPLMDEARHYADALEGEIANELWPYPTYQEMLFIK